jgi:hypothetical protein
MGLFRKLTRAIRGPRHHLGAEEKAWVERRLLWLKDQFGAEPLVRAPLGPKSPVWPPGWDASYESGAELLNKLCEFMRVDPARLELEYYSRSETHEMGSDRAGHQRHSGLAGLYIHPRSSDRLVIALEIGGLTNLGTLAATICHELGHAPGRQGEAADHSEGGLMQDGAAPIDQDTFKPQTIRRFRAPPSWTN